MKSLEKENQVFSLLDRSYFIEPTTRKMCQCGDMQCHNNSTCHNCGGKFNINPTTKKIGEVIKMKANFWYKGNVIRSLEYFFEILKRHELKGINLGEFVTLFKKWNNP